MNLKIVECVCTLIVIVIIFILKLVVDEPFSCEKLKRLSVDISVDIMSVSISFVISFIITTYNKLLNKNIYFKDDIALFWNKLNSAFIFLFISILFLIIVTFISKYYQRKYSETENLFYIIIGIVLGQFISITCIYCSIGLLKI